MFNILKKKNKFDFVIYILFLFFIIFFIKFSTVNVNANTYKVVDLKISKTYDNDFKKEEVINIAFKKAFELFQYSSFTILVFASLAVSIIHQIYFLQTGPFLSSIGIPDSQIGPAMTIGQFAEIITMAYLGYFLKRIGFKKVITIGIGAYCLRYAIFGTELFPVWVMVLSQAFHGFCYAFFFAAACFLLFLEISAGGQ